jgi:hypothetical protein
LNKITVIVLPIFDMCGLYLGVLGSPTKFGRAKMKAIAVTGKIDEQGKE